MQPFALLLNTQQLFPAVELELYIEILKTEVLTSVILTTLQTLKISVMLSVMISLKAMHM